MSPFGKGPPPGGAAGSPDRAVRSDLPIPVTAKIGAAPSQERRLHDVSISGFRLDWPDPAEAGQRAIVRFAGYPGVCPAFIVYGRVARVITGKDPGVGIAIDREQSTPESLEQYRLLVRHYLHHRPLLEEMARDFFEGRCESCEWIGRVGARSSVCPCCGGRVRPLDPGQ